MVVVLDVVDVLEVHIMEEVEVEVDMDMDMDMETEMETETGMEMDMVMVMVVVGEKAVVCHPVLCKSIGVLSRLS